MLFGDDADVLFIVVSGVCLAKRGSRLNRQLELAEDFHRALTSPLGFDENRSLIEEHIKKLEEQVLNSHCVHQQTALFVGKESRKNINKFPFCDCCSVAAKQLPRWRRVHPSITRCSTSAMPAQKFSPEFRPCHFRRTSNCIHRANEPYGISC